MSARTLSPLRAALDRLTDAAWQLDLCCKRARLAGRGDAAARAEAAAVAALTACANVVDAAGRELRRREGL